MSLMTQYLEKPYICYCGQKLEPISQEIQNHFKNCSKFKKQSANFSIIDGLLNNANDIDKLQEFQAVSNYFSQLAEDKLGRYLFETNNLLQQNILETNQLLSQTSLLTSTQKLNQKLLYRQNKCHSCKQFKELSVLFCLGQCYLLICKECISKCINNNLHQGFDKIPCACGKLFDKRDLISYLGKDYEPLQKKLKQLLAFTCKSCKLIQPVKIGYEIFGLKDPQTKKILNRTYSEHYRLNYVRCPGCETEQCRKCQAIPYHIGKNCEQFHLQAKQILCRYCESVIPSDDINKNLPEAQQNICKKAECSSKIPTICSKLLACKHPCFGFVNEIECPPCLELQCREVSKIQEQKTDSCSICYTEQLKQLPVIRARCGHFYHYECIVNLLKCKWNGPRIVLNFCYCPQCREWLQFPPCPLEDELQKYERLLEQIKQLSYERLQLEGKMYDEALVNKDNSFYNSPLEYAMSIYCYYQCFKCNNPYFGGLKDCQRGLEEDKQQFNPEELVCANCCKGPAQEDCPEHGKEYMEFKCKFCCTVAMWFCWGSTHFCDDCHKRQCSGDYLTKYSIDQLPKCQGADKCPLKIAHKPNGEEFLIGCTICRSVKGIVQKC